MSSDIHFFFFCDLTDQIVSLATSSRTVLVPFQRSSGVTSLCAASNAVNLLDTSAANCTAFSSLSSSRFRCSDLDFVYPEPCPCQQPRAERIDYKIYAVMQQRMSRESKRLKKSISWLNSGNILIQRNAIFVFPVLTGSPEAKVI